MIKVTKFWVRPNADVAFVRNAPAEIKQYRLTHYIATGKCLSEETVLSEDKLRLTYVGVWKDMESFLEHDSDATLVTFWARRDAYYADVGITSPDREIEQL